MSAILAPYPAHRQPDCPLSPFEAYRVSYRRIGWSFTTKTKTRTFPTLRTARAFVRKLRGKERPDLSPLCFVTIERRHGLRSRWTEV